MTPINIKRESSESIDDFLLRLGENLVTYDITWTQASKLLNEECDEEYSESRWRKRYNSYLEWKPIILSKYANNEVVQEVRDATVEMQKETVRFRDQKREYNQLIYKEARFENLKNQIQDSVMDLQHLKPLSPSPVYKVFGEDRKAIALWSDWHVGSEFKNSMNSYNVDVFRQRLSKLMSKTIEYSLKNGITELLYRLN
jgi:hypothetical protein